MKWVIGVFAFIATFTVLASFPRIVEAVNPDEALLRFFPDSTDGIGFVDVAQLRENDLIRDLIVSPLVRGRVPRSVKEFIERTGLDIERDVEQLMAGRTGADSFLVVIRTAYDALSFTQYFGEREVHPETYLGRPVYRPNADDDWVVSFADKVVFVGSDEAVRGALDRLTVVGSTALDNQLLVDAITSIEDGNQVWAVGSFSMLLPKGIAPPMATELVDSLESGTYQMRIDTALIACAVGKFSNRETALRATDLFRGLVGLGKMQSSEHHKFIQLLDGLTIETVESAVHINFTVEGELLRRLSDLEKE